MPTLPRLSRGERKHRPVYQATHIAGVAWRLQQTLISLWLKHHKNTPMHPELKRALNAFIYTISHIAAPIAFITGVSLGGLTGLATCTVASLALCGGYVMTSQPKMPMSHQEALVEILFWFVCTAVLALPLLLITIRPWTALSILLVLIGTLLMIWQLASDHTKARIRRAPLI